MADVFESIWRCGALFGLIPSRDLFSHLKNQRRALICQSLFWWCLVIFIFQVLQGISLVVFQYLNYKKGIFDSFPTAGKVSAFATLFLFIAFNFKPRLVFMKHAKLLFAIKSLKHFDTQFDDQLETVRDEIVRKKMRRFLILGGIWIATYWLGVGIPGLVSAVASHPVESSIVFGFLTIFQVVSLIHVLVTVTLFYIANLSVAIRLQAISRVFRELVPTFSDAVANTTTGPGPFQHGRTPALTKITSKSRIVRDLDRVKLSFSTLLDASNNFSEAFWLAAFLSLGSKLFMCTLSLYTVVYTVIVWDPIRGPGTIIYASILFLSDLGFFLIVLLAADTPVKEWRNLLTQVSQYRSTDSTADLKNEIQLFAHQINNSSFAISAGGMFSIGKHLIPGVCASVLTYIIVLLQSSTT